MCRLPAFIRELSALDGRGIATLEQMAREMRSSGYLPPSKRGIGSTKVDPQQAAHLLLASMTCEQPTATLRALEVYRSLKPLRRGGFGRGFSVLEEVSQCETFGAAIEKLIERAPKLKAEAMLFLMVLFDKVPPSELMSLEAFQVELMVQRPIPFARMTLRVINANGLYQTEWSMEWITDVHRFMSGGYRPEMEAARADKRTETTVTHKSIFRISDLIVSSADDDEEELCYA